MNDAEKELLNKSLLAIRLAAKDFAFISRMAKESLERLNESTKLVRAVIEKYPDAFPTTNKE